MKNNKLFSYIVMGAFIFFIIVGAIMFATYRSKDPNKTTIQITMWGTLPSDSFTSFFSRYFSDAGLKYIVKYEERDARTFDQDLVEALASGVGPDAIILPQDLIVRYSNKTYTIPYTVLPELSFKQTFIQEGEIFLNTNGAIALPFNVDPLVMYWNRDLFNNIAVTKPPATWSDISALVPKLTKKDAAQNLTQSTVALGEFRNINNAKAILSALIMQAGSPITEVDSNGNLLSALEKGSTSKKNPTAASLEFYTLFSNPSQKEYSWNRARPNSLDTFANGDLAIYFGFASEYLRIKEKNPNLNFAVAQLPQALGAKTYSTFGNMLGLAIMKNSKDPAGTYAVISALTGADAFPFWTDIFNVPSARRDILAQDNKNAVKTVFNDSAIKSRAWLDPDSVSTNAIFQEMVESYTTGRESLESAVSTASDRLDVLLNNK